MTCDPERSQFIAAFFEGIQDQSAIPAGRPVELKILHPDSTSSGRREGVSDGPCPENLAGFQDRNLVRQRNDFFTIMGDENHRHLPWRKQVTQLISELPSQWTVEGRQRLIEE